MNLMMAVHMSMRGDCSQKQEHCVSGYTIKEDTSSPSTHSFRGPPSVSLWTSWAPFSCTMRWWAWPCTVLVEVTKASVNWCMQQMCHVQTGLELYVVKDNLELTLQPPAPTSIPHTHLHCVGIIHMCHCIQFRICAKFKRVFISLIFGWPSFCNGEQISLRHFLSL